MYINMAELKNSSDFSFVKLNIGDSPEECGSLILALESQMPLSVQILNLIRVKQQKMFSPDRIPIFQFWSYELDKKQNEFKASSRDWEDKNIPLFLVCLIGTKYNVEGETEFQYRMMYSRETPSPEDSHLVSQFSGLFDFTLAGDMTFAAMDDKRYVPFLNKVVSHHGRVANAYPNWTMYLSKEKALQFGMDLEKISENKSLSIRPLHSDHAVTVNSNWKFGQRDGTLIHLRDQIVHSKSAGIFIQGNHETEDTLACWVISMPSGTINALHTGSDWRRKGLGEMAMKYISLNLAKGGLYPLVEIEPESTASKNLMKKLGFELAFNAAWVFCPRVTDSDQDSRMK